MWCEQIIRAIAPIGAVRDAEFVIDRVVVEYLVLPVKVLTQERAAHADSGSMGQTRGKRVVKADRANCSNNVVHIVIKLQMQKICYRQKL